MKALPATRVVSQMIQKKKKFPERPTATYISPQKMKLAGMATMISSIHCGGAEHDCRHDGAVQGPTVFPSTSMQVSVGEVIGFRFRV